MVLLVVVISNIRFVNIYLQKEKYFTTVRYEQKNNLVIKITQVIPFTISPEESNIHL